jgi:OmpA-OmpF porin, OOP family
MKWWNVPALAVALWGAAAGSAMGAATPTACATLDREARLAEASGDLDRMTAVFEAAGDPGSGCTPAWITALGRDVANLHVAAFFHAQEGAADKAEAILAGLPVLSAGLAYGETWQILLTLAEAHFDLGDFDGAAPAYQRAVGRMVEAEAMSADAAERRDLPTEIEFAGIHARMAEATLLASDYQAPPATRGRPDAGLYVERWRGYEVKAVPLPVQFEFGTTTLTPKGQKAAAHLAAYLTGSTHDAITLVGHTDRAGDEDANQRLSERRAEAVRDYLTAAGYSGTVTVVGMGESQPYVAAGTASTRDPALRDQLDRRVELLR